MHGVKQVFTSISRCPNVARCFESDAPSPCREIVDYQRQAWGATTYDEFQVPEPWIGEIDKAGILFVASNPSIGKDDIAKGSESDNVIWESHHLAFGGGSRPYIIDGIRTAPSENEPGHTVRYWCSVRARARELLPKAIPGTDYAITEVVHCKSRNEIGVLEAADECFARHFEKVMAISTARVIVALGSFATRRFLNAQPTAPSTPVEREYAGQLRTLLFLPHPSSFVGPKSIEGRYGPEAVRSLRNLLLNQ